MLGNKHITSAIMRKMIPALMCLQISHVQKTDEHEMARPGRIKTINQILNQKGNILNCLYIINCMYQNSSQMIQTTGNKEKSLSWRSIINQQSLIVNH